MRRRVIGCALLGACAFASVARADDCRVTESRAAFASLSGVRIRSIAIVTEAPDVPLRLERAAHAMHRVTRESVVRRQLLFSPGDTVDTLLVGETMRRLRRQRLYQDVVLEATRCDDSDGIALTMRVRDAWTLKPTVRLRSASALSVGVEERNLLGTGRTVSATVEASARGRGGAIALGDPWLFGTDVAAGVALAYLGGNHVFRAALRNHEYSVFEPRRVEASFTRITYADTNVADRALRTVGATALLGRRVGSQPHAATTLTVGAAFDSAITSGRTRRLGAATGVHARSFLGATAGVIHRTAQFDTASWIVPGPAFLDVPLGWEGDVNLGGGWERAARVPALQADSWLGRQWMPARGTLTSVDLWSSGYLGRDIDANHMVRGSAALYQRAPRGFWAARLSGERLLEVDADRRGLSLVHVADYTMPALRLSTPRSGYAVATAVERAVHLLRVNRTSIVDAGGFLAASDRWAMEGLVTDHLRVAVGGARFRLLTANGNINTIRLDVGYPIASSDSRLVRRGYAVVTIGTLFDIVRVRDGRR